METYAMGGQDFNDFELFGRRCGCPRPSYVERRQVAARRQAFREANAAFRTATDTINIPVRFIHITNGALTVRDLRWRSAAGTHANRLWVMVRPLTWVMGSGGRPNNGGR